MVTAPRVTGCAVHVREFVRQLLQDVRRNVGVVRDDDKVDGRHRALRHSLADEEEVVPAAARDVVVYYGARRRVLVLARAWHVVHSRVDPLLDHDVGELRLVAVVHLLETAQELWDLVVLHDVQLRVRDSVAEDDDNVRPSLVVAVERLETVEEGDFQCIPDLLLGLLLRGVRVPATRLFSVTLQRFCNAFLLKLIIPTIGRRRC